VAVVILLASLVLALCALTALVQWRRPPLKYIAYPLGWAAGEFAIEAIVLQALLVGFLVWWGWPTTAWLSWAVAITAGAVVVMNLILEGVQLTSRVVVARAMATSPVNPLEVAPPRSDAFSSWWRSALIFPFHPRSLVISHHVPYGPHRRHRLDVWRQATTPRNAPVMLYVHGGAWTVGDKREQGRPMLHELVARGWIAVAINYRLAPQSAWPAQIEDVTRALAWVKTSIREMGGDPDRIVVSGGSAGGHLASLLALSADDPTWRPSEFAELTDWSVRGCISFYGVLEMTGDADVWRGNGEPLVDLLERYVVQQPFATNEDVYRAMSPMERITADAPPFLVVQGTHDTLVDVNVARRFVSKFREVAAAPIYYLEMPFAQHAFEVTASPRTSATTRAVVAFVESVAADERRDVSSRRA
jgi:acetyl esterase/lipase